MLAPAASRAAATLGALQRPQRLLIFVNLAEYSVPLRSLSL